MIIVVKPELVWWIDSGSRPIQVEKNKRKKIVDLVKNPS
jgi:hypothetical protein